jgi:16S rRNA (uracil1498-N3)-methyltransferase
MARNFYIKNEKDLSIGDEIIVKNEELNHLKNVMRFSSGDSISIINGSKYLYLCKIKEINKNNAVLNVLEKNISNSNPITEITVYQALVKGEKLELITQKLTELGISKLVPFYTEFCQVKPNTTRIDRLNKINVEALKQSGRTQLLKITPILSFNEVLNELNKYDKVIFAYENAEKLLILEDLKDKKNIAIIIGSEGGFSKNEALLISSKKNVETVSLGKRILRAETSAIALSSLILFATGELN